MTDEHDRDELELLRRARGLERGVEPRRDLWPGISAELEAPQATRRGWRLPLALAATLLVGVTAVTMLWSGSQSPAQPGSALPFC